MGIKYSFKYLYMVFYYKEGGLILFEMIVKYLGICISYWL